MRVSEIQPRTLMGPGPSDVHPRVLQAMARPTIGHLDPQCIQLLDEIRAMLQQVFCTSNKFTLAVSGTGSAGMETAVVNLIEPGDKMLVCVSGVFGQRMTDHQVPRSATGRLGPRPLRALTLTGLGLPPTPRALGHVDQLHEPRSRHARLQTDHLEVLEGPNLPSADFFHTRISTAASPNA